jgi:opacity protein-like surface antigen
MRKTLIATGMMFALLALPAAARAQVFLTPFAGATFGGDTPQNKFSTGVAATFMGPVAGLELELGYTPDFFNEHNDLVLISSSNVTSFMANLLIGVGAGPVRPYGTAGVGLLRTRVDGNDLFEDVSANDWGANAGVGVIVMVSDHVGLRGDARYFASVQDDSPGGGIDLTVGRFDFWRAYGGLSIKF